MTTQADRLSRKTQNCGLRYTNTHVVREIPHPTPPHLTPGTACGCRHMVGIDIDSAVSPPAGFQLEVTVFHWV